MVIADDPSLLTRWPLTIAQISMIRPRSLNINNLNHLLFQDMQSWSSSTADPLQGDLQVLWGLW